MEFVILGLVGVISYWRGFVSGNEYSVRQDLKDLLSISPMNIKISKIDSSYYANDMTNSSFLGQSDSIETLVEKLAKSFPDSVIVVGDV